MKTIFRNTMLITLAFVAIFLGCSEEKKIATKVTGVTLNKTATTLIQGEKEALVATVSPKDAVYKAVAWKSSNTAVATVSNDGLVTAVKVGTATITVTTKDGNKTATCKVTVKAKVIHVTEVKLDKTDITKTEGETEQLTATVLPDNATNKTVTWSSSDKAVATVDNNGLVTAVKKGTATITVTTTDGNKTATCKVTVKAKVIHVTEVKLDKTDITKTEGETEQLTATVLPDNATNKAVTWSSSDKTVATVDDNGLVTAVKKGVATITVTTTDGNKTATCKVTVKAKVIHVTEVKLDKTDITKTEGETEQLTATVLPDNATDKTVTWSSSDKTIATVDDNGLVTAVKKGTATITVTTTDGNKTATCKVTVKAKVIHVTEVKLDKTEITKTEGETEQLTATVLPDNATNKAVTWSSSDKTIATVDNNGLVTAVKKGTATITVTTTDGNKTATCKVTVKAKVIHVTEVKLDKTEMTKTEGETEQLTATVLPDNATDKTVTWSSSDKTIATVDDKGLVTAVKKGTATITVTTTDGNKTATCKVTVKEIIDYAAKVFVKGGTFKMGSPNGEGHDKERPQHEVTVSDFYVGKYEVTNAQYAEFLNDKGNQTEGGTTWLNINNSYCQIEKVGDKFQAKDGKENYPVILVTWYGARAYAQWVGGRLPTEAEWEYAARGGNKSNGYKYAGSNNINDVAWYWNNSRNSDNNMLSGKGTHIVGTKQSNELGIYDMSGNVYELCEDTWHNSYTSAPTDGTAWVDGNGNDNSLARVYRGGGWRFDADHCRVANRFSDYPYLSSLLVGFRVVFDSTK